MESKNMSVPEKKDTRRLAMWFMSVDRKVIHTIWMSDAFDYDIQLALGEDEVST